MLTVEVIGPKEAPNTIVLLNGYSNKLIPKFLYSYPQISAPLNPHERSFFFIVEGNQQRPTTGRYVGNKRQRGAGL